MHLAHPDLRRRGNGLRRLHFCRNITGHLVPSGTVNLEERYKQQQALIKVLLAPTRERDHGCFHSAIDVLGLAQCDMRERLFSGRAANVESATRDWINPLAANREFQLLKDVIILSSDTSNLAVTRTDD